MSELDDDIEAVAGEYVLGTLDTAERVAVAARRQRDAALDGAIRRWERDFGPLGELGEEMAPPADLLARIERRLDAEESPATPAVGAPGNVVALRRRVTVWRSIAAASSAIAASLLLLVVWQNVLAPPDQRLVAVLQKDSTSPAFLVAVDLPTRTLTVKPLMGPPAADKSYELWLINTSLGDPRSLGVISAPLTVSKNLRGYESDLITGSAVAISLEPLGGSPTGKVTGPVLFSGPLISAPF
jgi:anti-sigma-K factor RskA